MKNIYKLIIAYIVCTLFVILFNVCAEDYTFQIVSGDANHNMKGVAVTDELKFTFNHRIDPCDNAFTIEGGDLNVSEWTVKGTELTVKLSAPLEYGTTYTLNLAGLSDLYGEKYARPTMRFTTVSPLVTENSQFVGVSGGSITKVNKDYTGYRATLTNRGDSDETLYVVMTLVDKVSKRLENVIVKQITVPAGGHLDIDEGFANIGTVADTCKVKVFYISDIKAPAPYDSKTMEISELN